MNQSPTVAIVSGGSRGLGRAIVNGLLEEGYHVASFSRSTSTDVNELEDQFAETFWFQQLDASNSQALVHFVQDVHGRWGRVDALVNNAGIAHDRVLALATDEQISQMLEINLQAAIVLARECSRWMLTQQSGNIINISSIIADRGFSGLATYAATKAGMNGMTRSLARELGPRGIRVNAIAPGYLTTDMSSGLNEAQQQQIIRRTPLGRLGTVEDVVPLVKFLLSPDSNYITGQVMTVDGGSSL